jgi:hypothetical protein
MLDKGSCLCVLGMGVGVVGASGKGFFVSSCPFLRLKTCLLLPLPAKLNGTNGKEAETNASQWKKTGYGVKAKPKTGVRRGAGAFSFSVVKEDGGTGTGRGWSADCTPVGVVWQSNHSKLRSVVVGLLYHTPQHQTYPSSYSRTVLRHSLSLRVSTL